MSGQEVAIPNTGVAAQMDLLVATVAEVQLAIERYDNELQENVRALTEVAAAKVQPLVEVRDKSLDELAKLTSQLLATPGFNGKSIHLQHGIVSVRTTSAIEIVDKVLLMFLARRYRIVREVSEPQPRKINKTMIGSLLKRRPQLTKRLEKAVKVVSTSHMTIKPPHVQTELKRELHPLRTTLPKSS